MTRPTTTRLYAVLAAAAAFVLAGCGGASDTTAKGQSGATTDSTDTGPRSLTVFAAASLQKPFEEIAASFEKQRPGVTVRFGFGGSSGLVAQLIDGAPADVLATANEPTMEKATDAGLTRDPQTFATNTLQIVVPQDNPAAIAALDDLIKPDVKVVLCAPAVPCGAASQSVETAAGIDIRPVSEEQQVTDVLGKVRSGEADAGLVYVTDVASAGGEVKGIDFPEAKDAINTYPIATVHDTAEPTLAADFVTAVTGPEGQKVLQAAGFAAP